VKKLNSKKVAIIDVGSNSIRIIIMKIYENGSYKMIDQGKEMVRLSENMGADRTLKSEPIQRTIHTLNMFKSLIDSQQVDKTYVFATAAVRNASNSEEFLNKIKNETGFDIKVISGEDEAYYDYLGVINTMSINDFVIIDVGGGSTELVWVRDRELIESVSIPYGAVSLSEMFIGKEKYSQEKPEKIYKFFMDQLKTVKWFKNTKKLPLVGLGGSVRTLAKIDRKRIGFPLESLHNYQMTIKEVNNAYEEVIKAQDNEERNKIPGVGKERADIIVGGLVPVKAVLNCMKTDRLIISGNGLREGVFYKHYLEEFGEDKTRIDDVLYHSVENILHNYEINKEHAKHVEKLALSIFDQTCDIHKMGKGERKLLSVSALLHDIGMYVDYYNHHRHSFYLLLNSRINGLRNRELVMCAIIVGMHRNMEFKTDWKDYGMLMNRLDYKKVCQLAVFLRISEMLDRNESGSVEKLFCIITDKQIQISLKAINSPELEILAAMKSNVEFEKNFRRKLSIIQVVE